MKQSNVEILVGAFVLLGVAAIVWLAIQAGAGAAFGVSTYEVSARFSNIGGLKPGSQVLIAGVPVGHVEKIDLDAQYAAIVHMNLKRSVRLPSDTIASIKTSGLIGDKFISLAPGAESGNLSNGGTITDTESAVDLESIISRFAQVAMPNKLTRSNLKSALIMPLIVAAICLSAIAAADDPAAMLRNSVDEVLSIAYSGRGNENLPSRVRPALEKCFVFDLVTRQAIGPGWRQFSAADQKRVTDLFSELMIRTYSARVVGTQRPKISYGAPTTVASDRCEIPTKVTPSTGNEPVAVVYRMIKLPVGWRIYDVLIEGVSFVANYRAQFDELVKKGGAPVVIKTLETKLAAPAASRS
jgi:outer membrane lipid asymmetry maintenance protein MlaD